MVAHPKWHAEQLNRYISDLSKTIHSSIRDLDNYHSNQHFSSSDNANDKNDNNLLVPSLSGNSIITSSSSSSSQSSSSPLAAEPLSSTVLNNTLHSITRRQLYNFSSSFVERLSDAIQSALTSTVNVEQRPPEYANASVSKLITSAAEQQSNVDGAAANDDSIISNYWLLLLIILYCVVVLGGIFGNASLIVTLFTQSSARLRNPLLVALCLADLIVSGVAAPLTVVALILDAHKTITSTIICKLIHFAQVSWRHLHTIMIWRNKSAPSRWLAKRFEVAAVGAHNWTGMFPWQTIYFKFIIFSQSSQLPGLGHVRL